MRAELRDVSGWRSDGLPITTFSDEAGKMLDSCITQLTSWREDDLGELKLNTKRRELQ